MNKPIREQIEDARRLLAATAPDPGPPRPDDMAELARIVAIELRKRGIWAHAAESWIEFPVGGPRRGNGRDYARSTVSLYRDDFDNLTPREIADVIQREEAAKAAEWAGDE